MARRSSDQRIAARRARITNETSRRARAAIADVESRARLEDLAAPALSTRLERGPLGIGWRLWLVRRYTLAPSTEQRLTWHLTSKSAFHASARAVTIAHLLHHTAYAPRKDHS